VDLLLQVLRAESFDLVVHAAGLETGRGQRRRQRNPFAPPQEVTPTTGRWQKDRRTSPSPCPQDLAAA